jgi:hypothetical protein
MEKQHVRIQIDLKTDEMSSAAAFILEEAWRTIDWATVAHTTMLQRLRERWAMVPNPDFMSRVREIPLSEKVENVWSSDDTYPRRDWRKEVANNDTNLGYWEWVQAMRETEFEY